MTNLWLEIYKKIKDERFDEAVETGNRIYVESFGEMDLDSFFTELLDAETLKDFKTIELLRCKPGQTIIKEGEIGNAMYIATNGKLRVTHKALKTKSVVLPLPPVLLNQLVNNLVQGKTITLAELGAGAVVGELAFLSDKPRSATVTALEETDLIEITRDIFDNVVKKKPRIKSLLLELYVSHLERSFEKLENSGKHVNTCVANVVYSKVKKTIATTGGIDSAIAAIAREFKRDERQLDLDSHLNRIKNFTHEGQVTNAIKSYLGLGVFFLKSITHLMPELLKKDKIVEQIPFLGGLLQRVNQRFGQVSLKTTEPSHARSSCETDSSDNFLSLFNDKIVGNLDKSTLKTFKDGEAVVKYGDTSDEVFVIKEGKARALSLEGREIGRLKSGNIFGEFAFITGNPRMATVLADGDIAVYELKRPLLEQILHEYPVVLDHLNEVYQKHVDFMKAEINVTKEEILGRE